ncbi:hypothetical protein EDD85DRAFT_353605 [Armillaria nabsnona]|nr:hypothetical protein EDD85DRAFT_353605 [Armillaria nabsnona]
MTPKPARCVSYVLTIWIITLVLGRRAAGMRLNTDAEPEASGGIAGRRVLLFHLGDLGIFRSISNLAGDVITIGVDVSVTLAPSPQ